MRGNSSTFWLFLPLVLGCAGKNVVAGEEKTKAEQLESALPSWCRSTCERLRACPENTGCDCSGDVCNCSGVDDTCETQCPASFAPFTNGGETCAAIGQRVKDCIDAMKCADLSGSDKCTVSAAEKQQCPDPNDVDDSPPMASGDSAGPSSGGTASAGPGYSGNATAGTASSANPVSCADSYGAGGGQPDNGGSHVTCEEGRQDCTDGREYSWICVIDSQGQRACSCLVDAHATAGFEPSQDCPEVSAVNAGCGWALTQ